MNLVPGEVGDGGAFTGEGLRFALPERWRAAAAAAHGRKVTLGIRPEAIHEAGGPLPPGDTTSLTIEVELAEPLGHEVVVHGRLGEQRLVATLAPHRLPARGSRLDMVVELANLHLFDTETEQRLSA